jgi:hypothetical protein
MEYDIEAIKDKLPHFWGNEKQVQRFANLNGILAV